MAPATSVWKTWLAMSRRRRSKTSARTPAGSARRTTGRAVAVWTSATRVEACGRPTSSHWAPTVCIQVPMLLTRVASQIQRKTGNRSGDHGDSTRSSPRAPAAPAAAGDGSTASAIFPSGPHRSPPGPIAGRVLRLSRGG